MADPGILWFFDNSPVYGTVYKRTAPEEKRSPRENGSVRRADGSSLSEIICYPDNSWYFSGSWDPDTGISSNRKSEGDLPGCRAGGWYPCGNPGGSSFSDRRRKQQPVGPWKILPFAGIEKSGDFLAGWDFYFSYRSGSHQRCEGAPGIYGKRSHNHPGRIPDPACLG